jgi:hypothetical protein
VQEDLSSSSRWERKEVQQQELLGVPDWGWECREPPHVAYQASSRDVFAMKQAPSSLHLHLGLELALMTPVVLAAAQSAGIGVSSPWLKSRRWKATR